MAKNETITSTQIRAARGFLAWDRRDLAKKSVVTLYAIERLETGAEVAGAATTKGLAAVKATLEAEGIEFTNNAGVLGVLLHPRQRSKSRSRSK